MSGNSPPPARVQAVMSYEDMTDEERRETYGSERYGLSEPAERQHGFYGPCAYVHWLGYVIDPKPTEELRARGQAVVVYGDAPHLSSNERHLGPTAYPLPKPWDRLWAMLPRLDPRRFACGGVKGARFISDSSASFRVPEKVYNAAREMRTMRLLPESITWEWILGDVAVGADPETVRLDDAGPAQGGAETPWRKVGRTCIAPAYVDLLKELGVEEVTVCGEVPEGLVGSLCAISCDVAIVMPVRAELPVEG